MKTLNEFVRKHPSTLARLLQADARAQRAIQRGEPSDINLALEDANAIRNALPLNPVALLVSLNAHLAAAGFYDDLGDREKRQAALDQAGRDSTNLKPFTMLPFAMLGRFRYFQYRDQEPDLEDELARLTEKTEHGHVAYLYMLLLYEQGNFAKARRVAESRTGKFWVDWLKPFVLVELPNGLERSLKAYKELEAHNRGNVLELHCHSILWFLGHESEAVAASLRFRQQIAKVTTAAAQSQVDYECKLISADELLRSATGDRAKLCLAHFAIALTKFAEGDRIKAGTHFGKVVATRWFLLPQFDMSRLFLKRMKKDPAWPPWIPVKK